MIMVVNIIFIALMIITPLAENAAANAVNPKASLKTPFPNNNIAPANINNNGDKRIAGKAANTNTPNAPPRAIRPFAIVPKSIIAKARPTAIRPLPRIRRAAPSNIINGDNKAGRAIDAANTIIAPPIAIKPFAIVPASVILNAAATADKPTPRINNDTPVNAIIPANAAITPRTGPKAYADTPNTANATAITIRPFARFSQLIFPKISIDGTSIPSATAASIKAAEPAKVPFITLRPTANISILPPNAIKPFATSSQLILPIFLSARDITSNADDNAIILVAIFGASFGIAYINASNSDMIAPIATTPLMSPCVSMAASFEQADAIKFIAIPKRIRPAETSRILPTSFPVGSFLEARMRIAVNAPIAITPLNSPPALISAIFFNADARTSTAVEIRIIDAEALIIPFSGNPILLNNDNDANKVPNNAAIAANDAVNLVGSIEAIIKRAAARIAIAPAIFKRVFAFKSC